MNYGYIYKTINLVNKKFYIGQHRGQFNLDYLGSGVLLQFAINKYDKRNFKPEIVCYTDDREQANILERKHIRENRRKYGQDMMYNVADGGEGGSFKYHKHTEKSKRKIGISTKKALQNPEIRKKISEKTLEAFKNPVIKEKHRLAVNSAECKAKNSLAHIGQRKNLGKHWNWSAEALEARKLSHIDEKRGLSMIGNKRTLGKHWKWKKVEAN